MKRDLPPALRRYLLTEAELTNEEIDSMSCDELFEIVFQALKELEEAQT